MNIDPRATIAGVPILEVRRFLRYHRDGFRLAHLTHEFGSASAKGLTGMLLKQGYVEHAKIGQLAGFSITGLGWSFMRASAARPVKRATAERALASLLDRCKELEGRPGLLYRVQRVLLFGSMLTPKPIVSDVDVVVELVAKDSDRDRHQASEDLQASEAEDKGHAFSTLIERFSYAEDRVRKFLKSRSRVLQFTSPHDPTLKTAKTKVVYPPRRSTRAAPNA